MTNLLIISIIGAIIFFLLTIIYSIINYKRFKKHYFPLRSQNYEFYYLQIIFLIIYIFLVLTFFFNAILFGIISYIFILIFLSVILVKKYSESGRETYAVEKKGDINLDFKPYEVAIVLNKPFYHVLFLILIELAKKDFLKVASLKNIHFKLNTSFSKSHFKEIERMFLKLLREKPIENNTFIINLDNRVPFFFDLIRGIDELLQNYDLKLTKNYYLGFLDSVWYKLTNLPSEMALKILFEKFEWILIDDKFFDKLKNFKDANILKHFNWLRNLFNQQSSLTLAVEIQNLFNQVKENVFPDYEEFFNQMISLLKRKENEVEKSGKKYYGSHKAIFERFES